MKLFFSGIFFTGIIMLTAEGTSLSHVQAETIIPAALRMNQAIIKPAQILWKPSDIGYNNSHNTHTSSSHPILHAIASLFGLNHSQSSSSASSSYRANTSRRTTYSNYSSFSSNSSIHSSSSFFSSNYQSSGIGGFFHGIATAISNGFNTITHSIVNGIRSFSHAIQTTLNISSTYLSGVSKSVQSALQKALAGETAVPDPLVPSAEVLANSAGKIPVILVHGGYSNATDMKLYYESFEKAGIPAYAPNLGNLPQNLLSKIDPAMGGTDSINISEHQLSTFINQVQKATGSPKVDLVGVSQGGLVMRDYLVHDRKNNIEAVATMGGAIHGSAYRGWAEILEKLPSPFANFLRKEISSISGAGNFDVFSSSPLVKELNKYPDTKPGINYLDIASNTDDVITPWNTASFLTPGPGAHVTNIETHTIPGVPANFSHGQYGQIQPIVDRVVQFIQEEGETGPGIPARNITNLQKISQTSVEHKPIFTPPTVSLLD